jgi:leucyl-tRNA synthetase
MVDYASQGITKKNYEVLLKLISPFCPHIAEELWHKLGNKSFISLEKWPETDESKIDKKLEEEEKAIEKLVEELMNR